MLSAGAEQLPDLLRVQECDRRPVHMPPRHPHERRRVAVDDLVGDGEAVERSDRLQAPACGSWAVAAVGDQCPPERLEVGAADVDRVEVMVRAPVEEHPQVEFVEAACAGGVPVEEPCAGHLGEGAGLGARWRGSVAHGDLHSSWMLPRPGRWLQHRFGPLPSLGASQPTTHLGHSAECSRTTKAPARLEVRWAGAASFARSFSGPASELSARDQLSPRAQRFTVTPRMPVQEAGGTRSHYRSGQARTRHPESAKTVRPRSGRTRTPCRRTRARSQGRSR